MLPYKVHKAENQVQDDLKASFYNRNKNRWFDSDLF